MPKKKKKAAPAPNHPKNTTRYRSLNKIAAHESVETIFDEGEDGIWIWLKPGWWTGANNDTSTLHEWTVRDLIDAWRGEYKPERIPADQQATATAGT